MTDIVVAIFVGIGIVTLSIGYGMMRQSIKLLDQALEIYKEMKNEPNT